MEARVRILGLLLLLMPMCPRPILEITKGMLELPRAWQYADRIGQCARSSPTGTCLALTEQPAGIGAKKARGGDVNGRALGHDEQYASGDYQRVLAQRGMVCSMSRRGDCWDNVVAESFFATLKVELVHDAAWSTRAAARTELFDYLELFYNGQRRHSTLGYLSPRAFEQQRKQEEGAT